MFAIIIFDSKVYVALAAGVLLVHALFVVWVAAGAVFTRSRPTLRWLHIACLAWGIFVEVRPSSCPLTILENWLESRAGVQPYQGGFLLHYLDATVYPDISGTAILIVGVTVCVFNLAIYAWRFYRSESLKKHPAGQSQIEANKQKKSKRRDAGAGLQE